MGPRTRAHVCLEQRRFPGIQPCDFMRRNAGGWGWRGRWRRNQEGQKDCSVALVVFLFPVPVAHSSLFPGVNRYFHMSFCLTRVIKVGFFRIFQSPVDYFHIPLALIGLDHCL